MTAPAARSGQTQKASWSRLAVGSLWTFAEVSRGEFGLMAAWFEDCPPACAALTEDTHHPRRQHTRPFAVAIHILCSTKKE